MVNSICGILTFKSAGVVGVETGGVEWALETTATSLSRLPQLGVEVRLYTHLHHVQDSMRFYGFTDREERKLFLALLSVNGVGPALARKILSGTTPARFVAALETEDVENLGSIPGLGKKTAQKIVLQLRGKLTVDDETPSGDSEKEREVVDALVAMGFDGRGAAKAVAGVLNDPKVSELRELEREREILRRAIVSLSVQADRHG